MSFFDHFSSNPHTKMTAIGRKLVTYRNCWFVAKISDIIPPNGRVLEVGPGKGDFARACIEKEFAYHAVEINETLANILRTEGFSIETGAVPPIPGEELFDAIYMSHVIEHMPNAQTAISLLESCLRHLKDDGVLILAAPDYAMWKEDFFIADYSHEFPVSSLRIKQMLEDTGFKALEIGYFTFTINGYLPCLLVSIIARMAWRMGIFHLVFGTRAYKVKISTLPKIYTIAIKCT